MENIDIKLVLDEIFGEQCDTSNNVTCDTCKYKCEDSSIISLADDGGIELRNYDIVIIRFNF